MTILLGVCVLLFLLAIGLPVALSLLLGGSIGLLVLGGTDLLFGMLATAPASAISSYELLTIPMFLLMAEFMVVSGISATLFTAIASWTGSLKGGLGVATALTGAAFGAISGSSAASAATLSTSSIPAMVKAGYEKKFAAGIVSISGTLAMIIPPSIAVIFYGLLSGTDIGKLLIAGIMPGILVTLTIAITVRFMIFLNPTLAPVGQRSSWMQKLSSLKVAGPFLLLFGLVTGLIYTGVATPVESSALGALGAFLLTLFSGKMTQRNFYEALIKTCMTSAMIGFVIVCAQLYGTFLTITGATKGLIESVSAAGLHPYTVVAILVVLYLVLGCFLDLISVLILTIPVVMPLVNSLGFDPIWFGILVILLAEIGVVTPPVGLNVFVVSRVSKMPVEDVFIGVWPHVFAHIVLIAILATFPSIILWLPSQMG